MKKAYILLFAVTLTTISFCACYASDGFSDIFNKIEKQLQPAGIKEKFKFSLGSVSCFAARSVIGRLEFLSDSDSDISDSLESIKGIQIGVYEINKGEKLLNTVISKNINKDLKKSRWLRFLKIREDDELVSCYCRQINGHIKSILFIVQKEDELVMVEIKGDVEKMVRKIIEEHG